MLLSGAVLERILIKIRLESGRDRLTQVLHSCNRFMSQSTLGFSLKKSSLLLGAVVTLGLVASPAQADHGTHADVANAEVVNAEVVSPVLSSSEIAGGQVVSERNATELTALPVTSESTVTEDVVAEDVVAEDTVTEGAVAEVAPAPAQSASTEAIDSVSSTDLADERTVPAAQSTPVEVAQSPTTPDTTNVTPGRTTRSSSSYIGVGGNIGLGDGDTALGESSFAVFSKIGLTSNISVRPGVLFSDDPTILVPLTLDFAAGDTDESEDLSEDIGISLNPYIGAGIAISTGGDGAVDLLATGGIDVPLSSRFTGTAAINATFFDNIAVGLLLGVGYNF